MFGLTPFNSNLVKRRNATNDYVDFYDIIDDFFNDSFFAPRTLRNDTFKIDVQEKDSAYLVEAELPGVKKEEISVDFDDGRLNIKVQRNEEVNEEKDNYIHRERRACSMQRSLYLKDIVAKDIEAKLEEGILKIVVKKAEKPDNKLQIEVK